MAETTTAPAAETAAGAVAPEDASILTERQQAQIKDLTPAERAELVVQREKQIEREYSLTPAEYRILKTTVCKEAPPEHAAFFMMFCKRRNLDPFAKHCYLMKGRKDQEGNDTWQIVSGIDGLRTIASRNPMWRGQSEPTWTYATDPDSGVIQTFTKEESKYGEIAGKRRVTECRVTVYRAIPQLATAGKEGKDLWMPFVGIARFDEFVQKNNQGKIHGNWEKQPEHQLRIRAEAMAERLGFPEDVGSIYTVEELEDMRDRQAAGTADTVARISNIENADPDPEDTEIGQIAMALGWTPAVVQTQLVRFNGEKPALLDHMRKQLAVHTSSSKSRAQSGEFEENRAIEEQAQTTDQIGAEPMMNEDTKKRLFATLAQVGVKTKPQRMAFANETCGLRFKDPVTGEEREIASFNDLTQAQALGMIDYVETKLMGPVCVAEDGCELCGAKHGFRHQKDCKLPEGSVAPEPQQGRLV